MYVSRVTPTPPQSKSEELAKVSSLQDSKKRPKGAPKPRQNSIIISQVKMDGFKEDEKLKPVTYERPKSSTLEEIKTHYEKQIEQNDLLKFV